MRYTLNKINEFIYANSDLDIDEETVKNYLDSINIHNLKYTLYMIKFIHLFIYSSILYFIIISVPNLIVRFTLWIFNWILLIIFVILLVEAFLKIYLQYDTDVIGLLDKDIYAKYMEYIPVTYVLDSGSYMYHLFKRLIL